MASLVARGRNISVGLRPFRISGELGGSFVAIGGVPSGYEVAVLRRSDKDGRLMANEVIPAGAVGGGDEGRR